jgi:hypothetical protein
MFEMRLEGGFRMFWSTITPTVCGNLLTMAAPEFCRAADFPGHCGDGTRGIWDLWPIDNAGRPHPLEEADRFCRPLRITDRTRGIALISFLHKDDHGWLWLELFLSRSELERNGRSAFEDWAQILRTTKDDLNKEAVLRLNLGIVTPDEIDGFRSKKKIVTTDLTLEVRPRAVQWRSPDT